MKNLSKILKGVTILFLIRTLYSIYLQIINLIAISNNDAIENKVFGVEFPEGISRISLWTSNIMVFILLIFLTYLLFILIKIANNLIKNKVFLNKNANQLFSIGIGIIIFTTILIFIQTPLNKSILIQESFSKDSNSYYLGYAFGSLIAKRMYIYITAIFILIISSLIKKGKIIQSENDLTI